ncbi:MAG: Holliday junction resolvase RuvX [Acidimicrobiia bacterium]
MGRVLGVDLGERRIGLALSDASGTLASPLITLAASGVAATDRIAILDAAREYEVTTIVVGLPLSMSGAAGPAAKRAQAVITALAADAQGVFEVVAFDERLTTVTAQRQLAERNVRATKRRAVVDQQAAAILLQAYLEGLG